MSLEIKGFAFDDYFFQTKENVLSRNGKPLSVTPKALQLLRILVENHGRLLEKDELIRTVWANSFVEEANLPFTISVLRKILEDDKQNPRFIETVPRRGYRFIAEVKEIRNEKSQSGSPPTGKNSFGFRKFLIPLSAFFLVGLIAVFFWFIRSKNNKSTAPILAAPFSSERFSSSGNVNHAAISPDGKFVAFVDKIGGKYSIWLRKLETSENIQIVQPSEEIYLGISFAHDGQTIYLVRAPVERPARASIYRVSAFGGVPEKVIDYAEGWISLSPNDRQISFVRCRYQSDDHCSLMIADADGRNERNLVTRPHPIRIRDNQFSPDGKSIAFAGGNSENGGNDFRLLKFDLTTNSETEISPQRFFNIKSLKWLPDGNNLLVAALDQLDGRAQIWQISATEGNAEPFTNDAANYVEISLNQDANRIVAVEVNNNFQLYLSDGKTDKPLVAAREVVFSPDGKLIFSADDNDIWKMARNGGELHQLTNNQFKDFAPFPSSDGKFIFFTSNRTGTNQVWRMNSDGSNQIQISKNEGGYPYFVTADGKWIYYLSGLHTNLWKVSSDGSQEILVLDETIFLPAFSPNGKYFAYFFRDKDKQIKISVRTLEDLREIKILNFTEPKSDFVEIAWQPDNKTINYITHYESKNTLWKQSLDEEKPHFIADLGDKEIEHFSISNDGSSYAYTRGEWLNNAVLLKGLKK